MAEIYEANKAQADYVAIDSCELHACEPGQESLCEANKKAFLDKLLLETVPIYSDTISSCSLNIYQLHTSR
jgi:hypothetical protein